MSGSKSKGLVPPRVCLVSFPMPSTLVTNIFLLSFIDILEPTCDALYVISAGIPKGRNPRKVKAIDIGTAMHFRDSIRPGWWSAILQFFKIVVIQAKICWALVRTCHKIDSVVFLVGHTHLFPPVLMARIMRKKVVVCELGPGLTAYKNGPDEGLGQNIVHLTVFPLCRLMLRANYFLADRIVVESEGTVSWLGLDEYRSKVFPHGALPVDCDLFSVQREYDSRDNVVAYIGRLHQEKGVLNFVNAIPLMLSQNEGIKFVIVGDGALMPVIREELARSRFSDRVVVTGWIPHEELPQYLNQVKLFVSPSYTEGLPIAPLEAMACGTPALVTLVGGVPDMIRDGETGFILASNSPECIANSVIKVLQKPELGQVSKNCAVFVKEHYSREAAVRHYRDMLYGLGIVGRRKS